MSNKPLASEKKAVPVGTRSTAVRRTAANGKDAPNVPVVISYLRYSSAPQGEGNSIARQLEKSEAWAKANGLAFDQTLRDEGVSAFRGANAATGALKSILRRIERHEIREGSTLVVENLDRLSRDEESVALELFLGIINKGVDIVAL